MLSSFPRDILGEIGDLIESVSEGFPTYSYYIRVSLRFSFCSHKHFKVFAIATLFQEFKFIVNSVLLHLRFAARSLFLICYNQKKIY